jgi:hypothetical protein
MLSAVGSDDDILAPSQVPQEGVELGIDFVAPNLAEIVFAEVSHEQIINVDFRLSGNDKFLSAQFLINILLRFPSRVDFVFPQSF